MSAAPARAWVEVDLGALVANARTVHARSGARLLPMVKANGYGLGAVEVARALLAVDPWGFGVATVEEGAELRAAGIARPIVVFTPLTSATLDACLAHGLRPVIGDPAMLRAWTARGPQPFHLEIDTGMGRSGVRVEDGAALAAMGELLRDAAGWEGAFTHFHSAETDPAATERQWCRLRDALAVLPRRPSFVHAANSTGALAGPRHAGDLVRPGIFLYGGAAGAHQPEPVAALRARVVAVRRVEAGDSVSYGATWRAGRPTTIATLAVGYADGILRSLSGRGAVELRGRRAPIVGRVTMDMTMIAAGDDAVAVGDVATVFGGLVSLDEQAAAADTISYELLTALGRRLPRHYRRHAGMQGS